MPSSDAWRELAVAVRLEEPEQLAQQLVELAPALEIGREDVEALLAIDRERLASTLEDLIRRHRRGLADDRAGANLERAFRAVETLGRLSVNERRTALDIRTLAELCRHPSALFLSFELWEEEPIVIARRALRSACAVLAPFDSVHSYLDHEALHFRWRDGGGGLDLRYRPQLSWDERRRVFRVPVGASPVRALPPVARTSSLAWLVDVIAQLGLLP
jgi:hypothetical protein